MTNEPEPQMDQTSLGRPRTAAPRFVILIALIAISMALGWVVWVADRNSLFDGRGGISRRLQVARDVPPQGRFAGDPYIGTHVCGECHPGEYALFTGSGHALTFRTAAERKLTDQLAGISVADPERPGLALAL